MPVFKKYILTTPRQNKIKNKKKKILYQTINYVNTANINLLNLYEKHLKQQQKYGIIDADLQKKTTLKLKNIKIQTRQLVG
jgi:UTP-glucose-1-phosphate uridylyltransferase